MTTNTDLANYALAHIGIQKVTDISDTGSGSALACNEFFPHVIQEVLREHIWNCAVTLVGLSEISPAPEFGWEHKFQLPGDNLRVLDLNRQPWWGYATQYFEVRGDTVLTNWDTVQLRYVREIEVHEMDPLLAEAIAVKLASKIAVTLSASLQIQGQMNQLYTLTVSKAKQANAIEQGAPDSRPLGDMYDKSLLVNARRRYGYGNSYAYGRYGVPFV